MFLGPKQSKKGVNSNGNGGGSGEEDEKWRVVYRNYATLYFVFVVDGAESELGILDLIQVSVTEAMFGGKVHTGYELGVC